jgi:hypothetical protein
MKRPKVDEGTSTITEQVSEETTHEAALRYQDIVLAARDRIETGYMDLAEALFEIKVRELYRSFGSPTFQDYCRDNLDVEPGRAFGLTKVWDGVKSLGLPRDRLEKMGWTKALVLVSNMNNLSEDDKEFLLSGAVEMSRAELTAFVARRSEPGTREQNLVLKFPAGSDHTKTILSAIGVAKDMLKTEDISVAMSLIASEWLVNSGDIPERLPISTYLRVLGRHCGGEFIFRAGDAQGEDDEFEDDTHTEEISEDVLEG